MKKILSLSLLFATVGLLAGCHDNIENTYNIDYFSAFGTEPYRDLEISGGIAELSSPMYDTNYETSVNIRKDGENYYFTGEELEGEFIKNDCIDGGKGDVHFYTVGVAKFREYSYEGCGDINGEIKMTDEEYESTRRNNNEGTLYEGTLFEQSGEPTVTKQTEDGVWNSILSELENCNVTSVFQTHSLKVGATTKDGNTFESVEPQIDAIVFAAQSASEKCGYEIMIATE